MTEISISKIILLKRYTFNVYLPNDMSKVK